MIKNFLLLFEITIFTIFTTILVFINTSARSDSQQNLVQNSAASSERVKW